MELVHIYCISALSQPLKLYCSSNIYYFYLTLYENQAKYHTFLTNVLLPIGLSWFC